MKKILPFAQIIVAIFLIIFILLQERGRALGSMFGESGGLYATRRGIEKKILWATIFFGILFILLAILNLLY